MLPEQVDCVEVLALRLRRTPCRPLARPVLNPSVDFQPILRQAVMKTGAFAAFWPLLGRLSRANFAKRYQSGKMVRESVEKFGKVGGVVYLRQLMCDKRVYPNITVLILII